MGSTNISIIGLGYVGLPLAHAFSKKYLVTGYDINLSRIDELKNSYDRTLELSESQVTQALENKINFTNKIDDIKNSNVYIITVPTPIDENKTPDLTPLLKATHLVASVVSKDDIVIYESTVYPGATEEKCVPILEKISNLSFNEDFFCGYSPERINPGDKEHTVTKILKITSGSTTKIAQKVDELYSTIITAGTYLAPSIKVAEAAKVIENSQRDINIAFMNELAIIFNKLNIDTNEVLKAAGTKWNFLPFHPGLVGGHCIGVDPYYLTYKAQEIGYTPEIILAGRRINDNMGKYIADQIIKLMIKKNIKINDSKVLVLGITFKENCPDIRNSKVIDMIEELKDFGCIVKVHDPVANTKEVLNIYNIQLEEKLNINKYDTVILAVKHNQFQAINLKKSDNQVIYDIKSYLDYSDARL